MNTRAMPTRALALRSRRSLLGIVLLALALGQTLGMVHRIVHSPLAAPASRSAVAGIAATTSAHASDDWLKALFAGHATEHGCELYDQSSHADLMPVDAPVVAVVRAIEALAVACPTSHVAARIAGFRARGPPPAG